jgi:signal transduction histidine kinase
VSALAAIVARLGRRGASGHAGPPGPSPETEAAERRRAAAFDRLPTIALRLDGDGRILEANGLARARFPFLEPGLPLLDAFTEHELVTRVAEAMSAGRTDELVVRLFAGGRRTYRVHVAPYDVAGAREALMFLSDASDAVAYQELRSQFVANVSHELRTPLTGLRGLLEALEDPEMDAVTQAAFVGRARRETERLEALIADVLFLSELEATVGLHHDERSDLSAAARVAAESLAGAAAEQGVEVEVDAPTSAWAPLTERMARTVVANLLENAVRYAGRGARARASVRVEEDQVVVEVADDGAGIAERHLPHVFERFYRADPSRSKRLGGTGLGLSIVKHIAEHSGGEASATSREGFGTTVRVVLPAVAAPSAAPGEPLDSPAGATPAPSA